MVRLPDTWKSLSRHADMYYVHFAYLPTFWPSPGTFAQNDFYLRFFLMPPLKLSMKSCIQSLYCQFAMLVPSFLHMVHFNKYVYKCIKSILKFVEYVFSSQNRHKLLLTILCWALWNDVKGSCVSSCLWQCDTSKIPFGTLLKRKWVSLFSSSSFAYLHILKCKLANLNLTMIVSNTTMAVQTTIDKNLQL